METLSNAATTASKMIWGNQNAQSGTEPVSGETGRGTSTEPYDRGNEERPSKSGLSAQETGPTSVKKSSSDRDSSSAPTSAEQRASDSVSQNDPSKPSGGGAQGVNAGGIARPEHTTDKTGVTSVHQDDPQGRVVQPTEANETRPNANAGGFGTAEPSVGADPKSAQRPEQKQQGGDRPRDSPSGEQTDAIKNKKEDGEALLKNRDPNDHSGEPMKMHDGSEKEDRSQSRAGQEGGGEHGKENGTGDKWIKTSGLAAEGGDFDAAKAGAGKEADRLLESKGIHKGGNTNTSTGGADSSHAEKPSKGQKIKEKLHLGRH